MEPEGKKGEGGIQNPRRTPLSLADTGKGSHDLEKKKKDRRDIRNGSETTRKGRVQEESSNGSQALLTYTKPVEQKVYLHSRGGHRT